MPVPDQPDQQQPIHGSHPVRSMGGIPTDQWTAKGNYKSNNYRPQEEPRPNAQPNDDDRPNAQPENFSTGGAIPDDNEDTQSEEQQADNSNSPRPIQPKPGTVPNQPKPFDPRDYLPGKQASSGAIPESGGSQGTDVNEALSTVDQVLQYGRSQSGLGAPPSGIPNSQPQDTGYARGGPVHRRRGGGTTGANNDTNFGQTAPNPDYQPQDDPGSFEPAPGPQAPLGPQAPAANYDEGGDVEDPANSSLVPQQEAIPTGDTIDPPPDSGSMGSAQGAEGSGPTAGAAGAFAGAANAAAGGAPQKIVGYLQGAGAASAKAVQAAEDASGEEQPAMKALAVINDAYKQGGPEAAWPIMQSYRQQHDLQNTMAIVKLQEGNVAAAAQAATEADAKVLDGTQTHFSPTVGGQGVTATTTKLGNDQPFQHVKMGLQQFGNFLKTIYDQKMDESTAVSLQKANKSSGAAVMGNIGPTDGPSDIGKQLGNAGAAISKGVQGLAEPVPDAAAAGSEPAAPGGASPTAAPGGASPVTAPGTRPQPGSSQQWLAQQGTGTPPAASGNAIQAGPGQPNQGFVRATGPDADNVNAEISQRHQARLGREAASGTQNQTETFDADTVAMARSLFPNAANDPKQAAGQRQWLIDTQKASVENTSKETQAAAVQKNKIDVADHNNLAKGQQNDARIAGRAADISAKMAAQGGNALSKEQTDVLKTAMNNNPRLAQDPAAAMTYAKQIQANWSIGTGGVNSGVRTPGAQVSAPQQNRTMIINNRPFLVGPDNKVIGPAK